jgi:ankyrin repeat protein
MGDDKMRTKTFLIIIILVFAVGLVAGSCATTFGTKVEKVDELAKKFFQSVADGNYSQVKNLIEQGVDVNARMNGCTALMLASQEGYKEIAGLLIEKGADIDAKNSNWTTSLMYASQSGNIDIVKMIIDAGADVSARDNMGRIALMYASESGHTDVVMLLITNGANVKAQDETGVTALMLASQMRQREVAELLIDSGADVNAEAKGGYSELMIASQWGLADVCRMLIDKGAEVNRRANDGYTALIFVSQQGHTEVAKLLIEEGADVNAADNGGFTSLIGASRNGHTDMVKLLIENGADVEAGTSEGVTALMVASYYLHTEIVQLIREARRAAGKKAFVSEEEIQVPEGVTYIRAIDEINKKAYAYLEDLFYNDDPEAYLPETVFCGPFLWHELIESRILDHNDGDPVFFRVPVGSRTKMFEGRAIKPEVKTKKLQLALKDAFQESNGFVIRKLLPLEMQLYWILNSWDIEEPVFMIESPGYLLLVDFAEDEVFYIDNFYEIMQKYQRMLQSDGFVRLEDLLEVTGDS